MNEGHRVGGMNLVSEAKQNSHLFEIDAAVEHALFVPGRAKWGGKRFASDNIPSSYVFGDPITYPSRTISMGPSTNDEGPRRGLLIR